MGSKMIDSASCVVWIRPNRLGMNDIKNYPPKVLKEGSRIGVQEKLFTDGMLGTIHFTEAIGNYSLSLDYPPEVYFEFKRFEIPAFKFQYHSRRGNITTDIETIQYLSIPEEINFIANGRHQVYNVGNGKTTYKLIVDRVLIVD